MPRDWDAATYDRVATGVMELGLEVVERLDLRGDETVLDAGCGTGRVTEALLERLPRGRVIAVDASPSMVQQARERLGERADVRVGDLTALDLGGERVDAVLSTATFHWIADHEALFARLAALVRPGGRIVAQCGGAGNIASVVAAMEEVRALAPFCEHLPPGHPWTYATPQETEQRLRAAGFTGVRCWLEPRTVVPDEPANFLRTVMLGAVLDGLPRGLHSRYVAAIAARLGHPLAIDYVRLNIDAVRAGA